VQDVANAVREAPNGTELVLDTHGSKNGIQLSKGNNITIDNIDKRLFQELAKRTGLEVQASSEAVRPYSVPGNEAATFGHFTTGQIMSFGP
jgi:hypothetical protein